MNTHHTDKGTDCDPSGLPMPPVPPGGFGGGLLDRKELIQGHEIVKACLEHRRQCLGLDASPNYELLLTEAILETCGLFNRGYWIATPKEEP